MTTMIDEIRDIIDNPDHIRNIAIAAHIDHGKSTLSDNLLAGAGLISEDLAGKQLATDFDPQEQERGITIFSANVSMVHEHEDKKVLINLIDTPGHVDFGGDVTRAFRAVDGALVLACAVDGVMPQTETVLRQALKERIKPILFINKVDRMIKELQLTPEQMMKKFTDIIAEVNKIIKDNAPAEFKEKWLVNVNDGSVAFGSAFKNWAISIPYMKKTETTFKDIIKYTEDDNEAELKKNIPLSKVVLDMVIKHLPNPKEAQKYRIKRLWKGDYESKSGKSMTDCNPKGPVIGIVTRVTADKHAGIVSTVRLLSGTLNDGDTVHLVGSDNNIRVQQVSVYNGPKRIAIGRTTAGNIIGVVGLGNPNTGETVCSPDDIIEPFEAITHVFEPVVTKSVEVKNIKDLPKVISVLKEKAKEDPTIKIKISEDTGEMLISGLGELHLEAKIERHLKDLKLDVVISSPIVIYKETVTKQSPQVEGKSPNKHNKFYITVEKLDDNIRKALTEGDISFSGKIRKQDSVPLSQEMSDIGFNRDEAKKIAYIYEGNIFLDMTRGVQNLHEIIELVCQGFREVCDKGPVSEEPCMGLRVNLMDAKLHEDAIHRGPSQVLPAVRTAIKEAMNNADATLLEPKQILRIDTPTDKMGNVMTAVQNLRGQTDEVKDEGANSILTVNLPVAEMFGFEAKLKSATGGRGFQSMIDIKFEMVPKSIKEEIIKKIRERKGLN